MLKADVFSKSMEIDCTVPAAEPAHHRTENIFLEARSKQLKLYPAPAGEF